MAALALEQSRAAEEAAARAMQLAEVATADAAAVPPAELQLSADWQACYTKMERLGLLEHLRPPRLVQFEGAATEQQQRAFARIVALTHWRARTRNACPRKLVTALNRVELFTAAFPHVKLWGRMRGDADLEQAAYNDRLFAWFGAFARESRQRAAAAGSNQDRIQAASVSGMISTLRAALGLEANQRMLHAQTHILQPMSVRYLAMEDAPTESRRLRLGLRSHFQLRLTTTSFDHSSPYGAWRWDQLTLSRNLMLRAVEMGDQQKAKGEARREVSFTWKYVVFFPRGHMLVGPSPFAIAWICPAKKLGLTRMPLMLAAKPRQADGSAHPLCPYAALVGRWIARHRPPMSDSAVQRARAGLDNHVNGALAQQHRTSPHRAGCVFEMPNGKPPTSGDVLKANREIAAACGLNPLDVGSNTGRISGAEEIYDACLCQQGVTAAVAAEQGTRLIKERGRWDSDIAFVYARPSVAAHLAMSATMGDHARVDIETLLASLEIAQRVDGQGPFAQPAHF